MGNQITSMTMSGTTVDVAVALTDNNSNLILSFSKYRHAYYTEIMAPVSGSQITLDAELDLKQVEKEFTLYFTESIYTYIGFYGYKIGDDAANTGYIISERVDNDGNMFGGFGEINGFDLYRTVISFKQDNYSRTYYKLGSAMEYNPYFGQPLTSVSKPLIADFSAMVGVPYLKSSIFFDNPASGDLEWEVVSPRSQVIPELKFMIKEVPTELKAKYPSLNLNEISFNHGSAVQYMDDFTYKDFILYRSNINDAVKRASNEYYYYEWE